MEIGVQASAKEGVEQTGDRIWISTTVDINGDNVDNFLQDGTFVVQPQTHLSIGTSNGEGIVNIVGNGKDGAPVVVSTSNAVFVGGSGYPLSAGDGKTGNNGTLTISNGAVFQVAPDVPGTTPLAAGAHMNIGTSQVKSTGTVWADNATLHSNLELVVGAGNSTGILRLTNGATVIVAATDNITDAPYVNFALATSADSHAELSLDSGSSLSVSSYLVKNSFATVATAGSAEVSVAGGSVLDFSATTQTVIGQNADANGNVSVTDNALLLTSSAATFIGYAGTGTVTVSNGAEMVTAGQVILGYQTTGSGTIAVQDGGTLTNIGTIFANQAGDANLIVGEGATVNNYNSICLKDDLVLNSNSTLYTGTMLVSHHEDILGNIVNEETDLEYRTGLYFSSPDQHVVLADGAENVVVGAYIMGKDGTMQYLSSDDYAVINANVLKKLGLGETENVTVANTIGQYITAGYTTDEINDKTDVVVSVDGGSVRVDRGESEGAVAGTIGSYVENPQETQANIRVNEGTSEGSVTWGGDTLQTVEYENSTIGNTICLTEQDGTLIVVKGSSLNLQGTVVGQVQVDGLLKGTGNVDGRVTVSDGGTLVIGNSPGTAQFSSVVLKGDLVISVAGTDKAASATEKGWQSGTYSQLQLDGAFTMSDNAVITIAFGGDSIFDGTMGKEIAFSMDIITGITSLSIFGETALTETAVAELREHTRFILTTETEGIPSIDPSLAGFRVTDFDYALVDAGNGSSILRLSGTMTVPEPATVTLSLLALAGLLTGRRRRK